MNLYVFRPRHLWSRLTQSPLFLSQIVTSGYGVVGTLSGAWLLDGHEFSLFSLLLLLQQFLVMGFRAGVGDASLVNVRSAGTGPLAMRHAFAWWAATAPITVAVFMAFGVSLDSALVLLFLMLLTNLHDCLRYRGIHLGQVWTVFWSDVARATAVATVVGGCFVSGAVHSAVALAALLWVCAGIGVIVLLARLQRSGRRPVRFWELRGSAAGSSVSTFYSRLR